MLNEVHLEDETSMGMWEEHNHSFDTERIKYVSFNSIKSVFFTKLEPSISQRQTKITFKIDSRVDGNLVPFKIFKSLLPEATVESFHATKTTW